VKHKPGKRLVKKGERQVGKITSGMKGDRWSSSGCEYNTGIYIPPKLMLKSHRMDDKLVQGSRLRQVLSAEAAKWLDLLWLVSEVDETFHQLCDKLTLILHWHSSHNDKSLDVIDLAGAGSATMICLPPHTRK